MQAEAHILKDDDNSEPRCRGCRGGSCSATDGKDSFGEFLKKSHPDYTGRRTGLEHILPLLGANAAIIGLLIVLL
jgi:hypothetical protein